MQAGMLPQNIANFLIKEWSLRKQDLVYMLVFY